MRNLLFIPIFLLFVLGCQSKKKTPQVTVGPITIDTTSDVFYGIATSDGNFVRYGRYDSTRYFEIADSSGTVALWENGKWEITNCESALVVMLKSVNELQEKNIELQYRLYDKEGIITTPDTLYASFNE